VGVKLMQQGGGGVDEMPMTSELTFRDWVAGNLPRLRRTAYLMCGDWHLADDVVQEALAGLYVHWRRVSQRGDVNSYVRRSMVNAIASAHRRPWRRERLTDVLPDRADVANDPADNRRDELLTALAKLGPSQRAIVVLRYWDDQSIDETAQALNVSTGTVKSQSARALEHLRHHMSETDGTLEGESR
jgi:RNA polymerase sigma-70 factor (sigma-E family)